MEEIWKTPLPELKEYCQVSNLGRVKYLSRLTENGKGGYRKVKEMIAPPSLNPLKYIGVKYRKKRYYVHRLVATAFIPNPLNLPMINHINGIKTDNNCNNLEWVTVGANNQHAYDTGLKKFNHTTTCKMKAQDVISMRQDLKSGAKLTDMAVKYGISRRSVCDIKAGISWKPLL